MKNKNFLYETDFEKENDGLINKIRSLKDAELSDEFDGRLHDKIDGIQINSLKRNIGFPWKNIISFLISQRAHRTAWFLSYSAALIVICFLGYLYMQNNPHSVKSHEEYARKFSSVDTVINKAPGNLYRDSRKSSENDLNRNSVKSKSEVVSVDNSDKIYKMVLKNLDYGFVYNFTKTDVKNVLLSKEFSERMVQIKNPVFEDSVRTVVTIIRDKM